MFDTVDDILKTEAPVKGTHDFSVDALLNYTPPPIVEKKELGWGQGMLEAASAGALKAATGLNKLVGLGALKATRDFAIAPAETTARHLQEDLESHNMAKNFVNRFVESVSGMGVTLPFDIWTGGMAKAALAGRTLPKVAARIAEIPEFAAGMGIRGAVTGAKEPGSVGKRTGKGLTKGVEDLLTGMIYGKMGGGLLQVPKMAAFGGAQAVYDAAKEGRLPTKEEFGKAVADGAAFGLMFYTIPAIQEGLRIPGERREVGHLKENLDKAFENNDLMAAGDAINDFMESKKVRPQLKKAIVDQLAVLKDDLKPDEKAAVETIYSADQKDFLTGQTLESIRQAVDRGDNEFAGALIMDGTDSGVLDTESLLRIKSEFPKLAGIINENVAEKETADINRKLEGTKPTEGPPVEGISPQEKQAIPGKDNLPEDQRAFIESKVKELGSVDKVERVYTLDDDVSKYAKAYARKLYGEAPVETPGKPVEGKGVPKEEANPPELSDNSGELKQAGPDEALKDQPSGKTVELKQPWEMTEKEWIKANRKARPPYRGGWKGTTTDYYKGSGKIESTPLTLEQKNQAIKELKRLSYGVEKGLIPVIHKDVIKKALSEGKSVPRNVLEEYKGEPWADEALKKLKPSGKAGELKAKLDTEKPPVVKPEGKRASDDDIQLFEALRNNAIDFNKPRVSKSKKDAIIEQSSSLRIELGRKGYDPEFIKDVEMGKKGIPLPTKTKKQTAPPKPKEQPQKTPEEIRKVIIGKEAPRPPLTPLEQEAEATAKELGDLSFDGYTKDLGYGWTIVKGEGKGGSLSTRAADIETVRAKRDKIRAGFEEAKAEESPDKIAKGKTTEDVMAASTTPSNETTSAKAPEASTEGAPTLPPKPKFPSKYLFKSNDAARAFGRDKATPEDVKALKSLHKQWENHVSKIKSLHNKDALKSIEMDLAKGRYLREAYQEAEATLKAKAKVPEKTPEQPPVKEIGTGGAEEPKQTKAEMKAAIDKFFAGDKTPRYSTTTSKPARSLSKKVVDLAVRNAVSKWANAPDIEVVQSQDDLPVKADGVVKGVFLTEKGKRKVYLVAENLGSHKDIIKTLIEEAVGHNGLREAFQGQKDVRGRDLYESVLSDVWGRHKDDIRKIADDPAYKIDTATPEGRIEAADEWLSKQIATDSLPKRIWANIVMAFKRFARSLGYRGNLSETEIKGIVRDAVIGKRKERVGVNEFAVEPRYSFPLLKGKRPKDAVIRVVIHNAAAEAYAPGGVTGSGEAYLDDAGKVILDGNKYAPGDVAYLWEGRFYKKPPPEMLKKAREDIPTGLLNTSKKLMWKIKWKEPKRVQGPSKTDRFFGFDGTIPNPARYPENLTPYEKQVVTELEQILDGPDEKKLIDSFVGKNIKSKAFEVGGFLHLAEGERQLNQNQKRAIYNYKNMGGRLGLSAIKSLEDKTLINKISKVFPEAKEEINRPVEKTLKDVSDSDIRYSRATEEEQLKKAREVIVNGLEQAKKEKLPAGVKPFVKGLPHKVKSSEFAKFLKTAKDNVEAVFVPEAIAKRVSEYVDPLLAHKIQEETYLRENYWQTSENTRRWWDTLPENIRLQYMEAMESGNTGILLRMASKDPRAFAVLNGMAKGDRKILDSMFQAEQDMDIPINYIKDYWPHIWDDPEAAGVAFSKYSKSLGKDRFAKMRTIDKIKVGLSMGLKLKTTNPAEMIAMRLDAGHRAIIRQQFINELEEKGLAKRFFKGTERSKKFSTIIKTPDGKQFLMDQAAADKFIRLSKAGQIVYLKNLVKLKRAKPYVKPTETAGMNAIDAPDGHKYLVPKELYPLIKNAGFVQGEGQSLWVSDTAIGKMYRTIMHGKNLFIPIKLGLSLFHPIHVLTIDTASRRANIYYSMLNKGVGWEDGIKQLAKVSTGLTEIGSVKKGYDIIKAYGKDPKDLTDYQKESLQYLMEGGMSTRMSEEWKINAKDAFRKALTNKNFPGIVGHGARRILEGMQKPIFEVYVPSLKIASFLDAAARLLKERPELGNNIDKRRLEFRRIAKETDNMYGELSYKTLFWNRLAKDIGIGSTLSMGWQLGFIREYGGGAVDFTRFARDMFKKDTKPEITRKMLFTLDYTIQSMIIGGLVTYALTGGVPKKLLDYFYPQTGEKDTDGAVMRFNTPFYTREFFALAEHIRKEGVVGGLTQTAKNKANPLVAPLFRMYANKDYYGTDIRDPHAKWYVQTQQALEYLLGEALPISVTSIKKGMESMSFAKALISSELGFTKAPRYITETSIQKKIFDEYAAYKGAGRTRQQAERSRAKRDLRIELLKTGTIEPEHLYAAIKKGVFGVGSPGRVRGSVKRFLRRAKLTSDIRVFAALSRETQTYLLGKMSPAELKRYYKYASRSAKAEFQKARRGKK